VVAELKVTLLGEPPKARETSPDAYALCLQARHLSRLGTPEGWEQSNALYQQALAIDPDYPAAWVGLGSNYSNETNSGLRPHDEGFRLAREADEKALAIDRDYAPAHSSLGWIAMASDADLAGAARHYERALELDPGNTSVIGDAASLLAKLGRLDEAIELKEYSVSRDPVHAWAHHNLGINYRDAGRLDVAIASFRTALRLSPGYFGTHYQIGTTLLMKGEAQAALDEFAREGDDEYRVKGKALALHALGRQEEHEAALRETRGDSLQSRSEFNARWSTGSPVG
jgi:tetratricopeptide (TPR) repeat protein